MDDIIVIQAQDDAKEAQEMVNRLAAEFEATNERKKKLIQVRVDVPHVYVRSTPRERGCPPAASMH